MSRLLRVVILIEILGALATPGARAASIVHDWSKRFGDSARQVSTGTAVDASGNTYVAGFFEGALVIDGYLLLSAGGSDIFVAKFNSAGAHQWSWSFGDGGHQIAEGVAFDASSGSVYVLGDFQGTVNFGGGNLTSAGSYDVFLAKFNSAGVHQWSKRFGDSDAQLAQTVAVDGSGNVVITGQFVSTVDFGGGVLTATGYSDIYLAKFNSAGVHQWSKRYGAPFYEQVGYPAVVTADASGNVIAAGGFEGTIDFGGGNLANAGWSDMYLLKLDAAGNHLWSERFGDTGPDNVFSVATDLSGNVIMTGAMRGTVDFGGGNLTAVGNLEDVFLAKFDGAGAHQWSHVYGDSTAEVGYSVKVDAYENVFLGGVFYGSVSFGGDTLTSAGSTDIFLAGFDAAGGHRWSHGFGNSSFQLGPEVGLDASNNVYASAGFFGAVNFGGGDLVSAGAEDFYVVKFNPGPEPTILDITDVGNDQGRQARIRFERSELHDAAGASEPITQYEAYLRSDPLPASPGDAPPGAPQPASPAAPEGAPLASGWAFVGAVPAHAESEYEIYVATAADSTIANGQRYSVFFIRAATSNPYTFFDSAPDSGYTLDNLGPGAPAGFAYSAGMLTWDGSDAPDLDHYTVYGSSSPALDASSVLVGHTTETELDVSGHAHDYYFVTATDVSGNEGEAASVGTLTGVDDSKPTYSLGVNAYPNPFNPGTTIRYDVPSSGRVVVSVYTAAGARVATLVDTHRDAGSYSVPWEGRDDRGAPVSTGIYFVKVTFGNDIKTRKVALVK